MAYKIKNDVEVGRGLGLGNMTTTARVAFVPPVAGYKVWDSTLSQEFTWDGTAWQGPVTGGLIVPKSIWNYTYAAQQTFTAGARVPIGAAAGGGPRFVRDAPGNITYNGDATRTFTLRPGDYHLIADLCQASSSGYAEYQWINGSGGGVGNAGRTYGTSYGAASGGYSHSEAYVTVLTAEVFSVICNISFGISAAASGKSWLSIEEV